MNLLKPSDFPQLRGRARQLALRIQNGNRLVLSPQAAFEMGMRPAGKKGYPVLVAQEKQHVKISPAGKDQQEDAFPFQPSSTNKTSQNPPFAYTNAALAQHILTHYGIDSKAKSVVFKIKADKDWWVLQPQG